MLRLILTPAFQRLKHIRFLGAIDYRLVRHPNGQHGATRHSRYEHSIGVLKLAHLYSNEKGLSLQDRNLVCASALLHDIGHPPLSHSLEGAFRTVLGMDHHQATRDIILGKAPIGSEVYRALRASHVDIDEAIALTSGGHDRFDDFFAGPISFDTIEGISRSWSYIGRLECEPPPKCVALAAIRRSSLEDQRTIDNFWKRKNDVYSKIIHSSVGILSDFASKACLIRSKDQLGLQHFFGTERSLFRKIPSLLRILTSKAFEKDVITMVDSPISYESRHYYVDKKGDFFSRRDRQRYRHSRTLSVLSLDKIVDQSKPLSAEEEQEQNDDLF